jgi:threonine synthase
MKYISTRGDKTERHFCEILLEGLAPDGGLYLPVSLASTPVWSATRRRR